MTSRSWVLGLLLVLCAAAGIARAEPGQGIELTVLVGHASDGPGGVDPRAQKLAAKLNKELRYESLRVLQSARLRLALDEVSSVQLPNGKQLRLRPLQVGESGVLLAVGLEGTLQTDLRIRNGHLVVIGAERYQDGKLVIGLEPHW